MADALIDELRRNPVPATAPFPDRPNSIIEWLRGRRGGAEVVGLYDLIGALRKDPGGTAKAMATGIGESAMGEPGSWWTENVANPGLAGLRSVMGGGSYGDELSRIQQGWEERYPGAYSVIDELRNSARGKIAQQMVGDAPNIAPLAFHGSPHVFDRFSMQKIGTGEGAQAYGHGLYFTSKPEVAEQYRAGLSQSRADFLPGVTWEQAKDALVKRLHAAADAATDQGIAQKTRRQANWTRSLAPDVLDERSMAGIARDYGVNIDDFVKQSPGAFYSVDLPDNLLDYDKPLSAQAPEAKRAIEMAYLKNRVEGGMPIDAAVEHIQTTAQDMNLQSILRLMERKGPADVTAQLKAAGIPGHRYVGDSSGVENYVIYDDSQIKTLGRYPTMADYLRSKESQ